MGYGCVGNKRNSEQILQGCSAAFMWLFQNLQSNLKLHTDILTGSLLSSRRNPCKPDTGIQASFRQQKGICFLLDCPDTRFLAIFGLYTCNLPWWLFEDSKQRPEPRNAQTMRHLYQLLILTQTTTRPGALPSRPSPQGDGALRKWCSSAFLPHQALPLPLPRAHRQRTLAEANCTDTGRTWPVPTDNRDFSQLQHIHATPRAAGGRSGAARAPLAAPSPPGHLPPAASERNHGAKGRTRATTGYRRHPARPPRITRARAGHRSRSAPRSHAR